MCGSTTRGILEGAALGAFLCGLAACSDDARETIRFVRADAVEAALQNTRTVLLGASNASAFLERSPILAKAVDVRDGVVEFKSDADESIDRLVTYLKEHVLADGNLESEDAASATYLMRPAVVCDANDARCDDYFAKHTIRLVLTTPSAGDVDVALLYTDGRQNPVTVRLHRSGVGVVVDLGASAEIVREISDAPNLPDQILGTVLFELLQQGELDYSLRVSVTKQINVIVTRDAKRYVFALGATVPTWEVRADGNAHTLEVTENLGWIAGSVPLSEFADSVFDLGLDEPTSIDPIDLLLLGITGRATLNGSDDVLHVTGMGLGDKTSWVKDGKNVLFSLDFNATAERRFDFDVSVGADDAALVEVSPGVDLTLGFAFSHIADRVRGLPKYALDDTIRIALDGAVRPAVKEITRSAGRGLAVVAGNLSLTSRTSPDNDVTVGAGQCLLDGTSPPGESHPLGSLQAGACP